MNRYWLLLACVFAHGAKAAPAGIDAGSLSQQMERDQHVFAQPSDASTITPLQVSAKDDAGGELHFIVQRIILTNVSAFNEDTLLALLSDTTGQSISLAELRERIKRISDYYHQHGYPAAYVYLPEQTIENNGEVEIRVLEGYLGELHLHNQSRLTDAAARARLPEIKPGDLLLQPRLERSVLLVSDIPGVRVQTTLNPGQDTGFTDVDIILSDRPVVSAQVGADNQGNRYTGDGNRVTIRPEISNLTGYGDRLLANLLYGGYGMRYSQFQYQLPTYWTGDGRLGVEYGEVDYRLGREFQASGSQGTTRTTVIYGNYPILRGDLRNLTLEVRHQEKMIRDQVLAAKDNNERRSYSQVFGFSGDWRDSGINLWNFSYTRGGLGLMSQAHLVTDAASAHSSGHFSKYNWSYTRLQAIPTLDSTSLTFALSGQINPARNLDSSEKIVLGGARGVRAYPSSEGISDQATLITLELKHQFIPRLQTSVFYDYAKGKVNNHPWAAIAKTNRSELGGVGVGMRVQLGENGFISLQCAWRTTHFKPTSSNDTPGGRVWMELGWGL
jgi:hemolysin activation/secretion protein